jgi:tetratricopeptide (TPR) repeat protein
MARSTMEVPWDTVFPQICARCTDPATKIIRIQRQKVTSQRRQWVFWLGLIGAAIAGARKDSFVRFEIPYCESCHRQDRILLWATWGTFLLGLLFMCGFPVFTTQVEMTNNVVTVVGVLILLIGVALLLIVAPALAIVRRAHQAVHIKRFYERTESVQLAFRNPSYFERFWQDNLERIISFVLRHDKQMSVPLEQAIDIVSKRIDDQNPRSPESLKGYFERGQLYLRSGRNDRALADLDRVVGVTGFENPYFLEAQFFRGQAYMQLSHNMQAQTDLENYIKASSDRAKVQQAKRWLKQLRRA